VCHSRTRDLTSLTRQADILVAAVGKPEFITGAMLKPGAIVIDAGYNRVEGRTGDVLDAWNADPSVHGVLIQHPVPAPLDEPALLRRLDPRKDVDGITPYSLGALVAGEPAFGACTPLGIIRLLDAYELPIEGKHAVVVGRSVILGKPMALMLLNRNATVTVCHSRTRDLTSLTRQADILVAAVGKPEFITGAMLKPGAIVIDAGYNRVEGRTGDVGDVAFDSAAQVASAITPVPGGVGPMTVATLLQNTVEAAERYG